MTRRTVIELGLPAEDRSGRLLWLRCCAGLEPAEALHARDREDLVAELVRRGWSDLQIAEHTRMTCYTTARIRRAVGMPANRDELAAAAA